MKKVAILTRTSTINFGTILQNFALQKYIEKSGYNVVTIDDKVVRKPNSAVPPVLNSNSVITALKERINYKYDHIKENQKNTRFNAIQKKCKRFKKKQIKYYRANNLQKLNEYFDVFLSGSDQIWSDKAEPALFPFFMQDFVSENKRKISYGVSVGARFEQKNELKVKMALAKLDSIAVREPSSKDIISELVDKNITIVCDPVLLLDTSEWKRITGKRINDKKYIFCYFLSNNDWYYQQLRTFLNTLEYDEVIIFENTPSEHNFFKKLFSCSPEEFLNYIQFAEHIITDSYHALLFSTIFQKSVTVLERYNEENNCQNGRISFLLSLTDMECVFTKKGELIQKNEIDYFGIEQKLSGFIAHSKNYLEAMLRE